MIKQPASVQMVVCSGMFVVYLDCIMRLDLHAELGYKTGRAMA